MLSYGMFYTKSELGFTCIKSDKDRFWIWPFERKLADEEIKQVVKNFKTYKHIWTLWQNNKFVFEYFFNGLNLIYQEFWNYCERKIKIFVINKVWKLNFLYESKFIKFFEAEDFTIQNTIYGWMFTVSEKEFIEKLPILNWFVNKFWFVYQAQTRLIPHLI